MNELDALEAPRPLVSALRGASVALRAHSEGRRADITAVKPLALVFDAPPRAVDTQPCPQVKLEPIASHPRESTEAAQLERSFDGKVQISRRGDASDELPGRYAGNAMRWRFDRQEQSTALYDQYVVAIEGGSVLGVFDASFVDPLDLSIQDALVVASRLVLTFGDAKRSTLAAFDTSTGRLTWKVDGLFPPLASNGDVLYAVGESMRGLVAVCANSGKRIGKIAIGEKVTGIHASESELLVRAHGAMRRLRIARGGK
jgi:hypothetical protein